MRRKAIKHKQWHNETWKKSYLKCRKSPSNPKSTPMLPSTNRFRRDCRTASRKKIRRKDKSSRIWSKDTPISLKSILTKTQSRRSRRYGTVLLKTNRNCTKHSNTPKDLSNFHPKMNRKKVNSEQVQPTCNSLSTKVCLGNDQLIFSS